MVRRKVVSLRITDPGAVQPGSKICVGEIRLLSRKAGRYFDTSEAGAVDRSYFPSHDVAPLDICTVARAFYLKVSRFGSATRRGSRNH